jgi:hypothetical protein
LGREREAECVVGNGRWYVCMSLAKVGDVAGLWNLFACEVFCFLFLLLCCRGEWRWVSRCMLDVLSMDGWMVCWALRSIELFRKMLHVSVAKGVKRKSSDETCHTSIQCLVIRVCFADLSPLH